VRFRTPLPGEGGGRGDISGRRGGGLLPLGRRVPYLPVVVKKKGHLLFLQRKEAGGVQKGVWGFP